MADHNKRKLHGKHCSGLGKGVCPATIVLRAHLDSYSHIVLDEVHERFVEADFLMTLLRLSLSRPQTIGQRIIVTLGWRGSCWVFWVILKIRVCNQKLLDNYMMYPGLRLFPPAKRDKVKLHGDRVDNLKHQARWWYSWCGRFIDGAPKVIPGGMVCRWWCFFLSCHGPWKSMRLGQMKTPVGKFWR